MSKLTFLAGLAIVAVLSGCMQPGGGTTEGGRILTGAVAGAAISELTGNDALTGAALGGLAGATCDDLNVALCQ